MIFFSKSVDLWTGNNRYLEFTVTPRSLLVYSEKRTAYILLSEMELEVGCFIFVQLYACNFDSRCTYRSERCRNGTVTPTLTDLGVCYTFNNDPNNQLVSDASGKTNRSLKAFRYTVIINISFTLLMLFLALWQQYDAYCRCFWICCMMPVGKGINVMLCQIL